MGKESIMSRGKSAVGLTAATTFLGSSFLLAGGITTANAEEGDGSVTVQVIRDVNANGSFDENLEAGVEGIEVTLEDAAGTSISGETNADGSVSLDAANSDLIGGRYRVRATIPEDMSYLQPAVAGELRPLVDYVDVSDGADANLTMGVWNPADYTGEESTLVTGAQTNLGQDPSGTTVDPDSRTLMSFPFSARGTDPAPEELANHEDTGALYGIAVQQNTGRIFSGAFAKRHTTYGPGGPGAIYVTDGGETTTFATVADVGETPHSDDMYRDPEIFDAVGKESLGDIELSEDGSQLFVVNMNTKALVGYDATGEQGNEMGRWEIPDPGCAAADDWRPMGLSVKDGQLYVGGVCSAESTDSKDDLRAVVWSVDVETMNFGDEPVLDQPLDFQRGASEASMEANPALYDQMSYWNPWQSDLAGMGETFDFEDDRAYMFPMPMLSDIAVESDGSLILGFRDRLGDQLGHFAGSPDPEDDGQLVVHSNGDLNKACRNDDGTFSWEGTGDCPNNHDGENGGTQAAEVMEFFPGEFYNNEEQAAFHEETAQGAIAIDPAQERLASTVYDPIDKINSSGVGFFDRTSGDMATGTADNAYEISVDQEVWNFGKANGLADLELLTDPAPVQVGSRTWFDANQDGIQDPDEPALPGVTVTLTCDGEEIGTKESDEEGRYYFGAEDGLEAEQDCTAEFDFSTADTSGVPGAPDAAELQIVPAEQGDDPAIDSNAAEDGTAAVSTGAPGTADHTIDAGAAVPTCTIGDLVWEDTNQNGVQDEDEPGIADVTVTLVDENGEPVELDGKPVTTVTDEDGMYVLNVLDCGDYQVKFDAPEGYTITEQGAGDDPAKDSNPDPETGVTEVVPLDDENPEDLTVDAGLVPETEPTCYIGDVVWEDTNGNGVQDEGEPGIADVTVTLVDENGEPVQADDKPITTITDENGKYLLNVPGCGDYQVEFEAPEGYSFTEQGAGDDPAKDSNPDPETGVTDVVPLDPEEIPEDNTIDAGLVPEAPSKDCTIGDFVWEDSNGNGVQDEGEPGVADVTVTLVDENGEPVELDGKPVTTVTDEDGMYVLNVLDCGDYQVKFDAPEGYTIAKPGAGDDPAKDSNPDPKTGITDLVELDEAEKPEDTTVDAGLVPAEKPGDGPSDDTCALGDMVWEDTNGDGIQNEGDAGIPHVTVKLMHENGDPVLDENGEPMTAVTDENGHYTFSGVECVTFELEFVAPDGYSFTKQGAGDDPAKDSDADPETGKTGPITLDADENPEDTTVDAGLLPYEDSDLPDTGAGNMTLLAVGVVFMLAGVAVLARRRTLITRS